MRKYRRKVTKYLKDRRILTVGGVTHWTDETDATCSSFHQPLGNGPWYDWRMQHSLIEGNEETIAAPKAFSDDLDNLIKHKLVTFIEAETQSVEDVRETYIQFGCLTF